MERRDFLNACIGGLAGMNVLFSSDKLRFSPENSKKNEKKQMFLLKFWVLPRMGVFPR